MTNERRLLVVPTTPGWVVGGVALASYAASWAGAGIVAGTTATFAASLLVVSLAAAWFRGRGLRIAAPGTTLAQAGDRFALPLAIVQTARRTVSFDVLVSRSAGPGEPIRAGALIAELPPLARRSVDVDCGALPRGVHPQGLIELDAEAPAGLARCRVRFALEHEIVALPRLGSIRGDALAHVESFAGRADGSAVRGDGQEFHGLRGWREGESLRHVHWKLSARRARLLVREFGADPRPPVLVILSRSCGIGAVARDRFEDAVSLAATFVEHHVRAGHDVRLALAGEAPEVVACPRGRDGLLAVLRRLAEVRPMDGATCDSGAALRACRAGEVPVFVTSADARSEVRGSGRALWLDVRDAATAASFRRTSAGRASDLALGVRR